MGRMLGAFAEDEGFDRPDLNQCPDCNCFFAEDHCPICGKECPENMRAGNRPAVKPKRKSRGGRYTYVSWYHTGWFMGLMLLLFPVVGIILLITSPHRLKNKIILVVVAIAYSIVSFIGIGNIISGITDLWDSPIDTSLTREEYVAKCETVSPEQLYRSADLYEDKFVSVTLRIDEKVTYVDSFYSSKDYVCYLAEAEDGSMFKIIIRDCLLEDRQRFVAGDVITVYGEGAGEREVCDSNYNYTTAPCINMAYVVLK